jgi:hypothetical protein
MLSSFVAQWRPVGPCNDATDAHHYGIRGVMLVKRVRPRFFFWHHCTIVEGLTSMSLLLVAEVASSPICRLGPCHSCWWLRKVTCRSYEHSLRQKFREPIETSVIAEYTFTPFRRLREHEKNSIRQKLEGAFHIF